MSMHRSLAAGLWLLAAVVACAVVAAWADDAQSGKLPPWTLVVLFWSVALVSVVIHHLSQYLACHLAGLPDALNQHGVRWSLAVRRQVRRLGRLVPAGAHRAAGRPAQTAALRMVAADGAVPVDRAGSVPSSEVPPWTIIVVLQAATGVSTAAEWLSRTLAQVQDALRRGWRQLGPAVGPYIGKVRLLRAAGGQSVALAARLGNLIGSR